MFDKIRTPDWADTLSDSVSEGRGVGWVNERQ